MSRKLGISALLLFVGGSVLLIELASSAPSAASDRLAALLTESGLDGDSDDAEIAAFSANERVAGVERGLGEAKTLAGASQEALEKTLAERREELVREAREAASVAARELTASRVDARRRRIDAALSEAGKGADDARSVAWVILGFGVVVLLGSFSISRSRARQEGLDGGARLAEAQEALRSTRADLQGAVDEKTAALGVALEESRDLNARLKLVLAELEQTQERLVQQEKMAALGTLAGGVAHEFNNILGGIRGCAEDLLSEAVNADDKETLEVVVRAARKGRTIVDGLMTFSRGATREVESVGLAETVAEVVRLTTPEASVRGVEIETSCEEAVVMGDPVALSQVILNLLKNAITFSPTGETVEVVAHVAEGRARVSVADRGAGVPEAHRERIFEPFFTTRELDGGSGLGLAISHGIVLGMGGSLTFEARDGGGTTFIVDLPLAGTEQD